MARERVLQERVAALKSAVNWWGWEGGGAGAEGDGVLALHIRRGDRMITRRLVTVAEYLDAAAHVVSLLSVLCRVCLVKHGVHVRVV